MCPLVFSQILQGKSLKQLGPLQKVLFPGAIDPFAFGISLRALSQPFSHIIWETHLTGRAHVHEVLFARITLHFPSKICKSQVELTQSTAVGAFLGAQGRRAGVSKKENAPTLLAPGSNVGTGLQDGGFPSGISPLRGL